MANKDLRDWISALEAAGELKVIKGAEPREEIGGIVDIYMRKMGNPAVMFDEVPGYPRGHRVIANILTSVPRINVALGLPLQASEMDLIQWWRNYMRDAPTHAPRGRIQHYGIREPSMHSTDQIESCLQRRIERRRQQQPPSRHNRTPD